MLAMTEVGNDGNAWLCGMFYARLVLTRLSIL
jgi:hypothetical protein